MTQTLKKDLFVVVNKKDLFGSFPTIEVKRRNNGKKLTRPIPSKSDWKDKHGSWAVMKGIVKLEQ